MKKRRILQKGLLVCSALVLMTGQTAFAQKGGNEESYTYTVTLYSGKQGVFSETDGIQVDNHTTGSSYQIREEQQGGEKISITGLQYGDMVIVSAPSSVSMDETSRYYVKGIRESGHDNNTAGASAFRVESDREYVVAYGIKGDMVSYVVNYQDTEGNTLAESQQFYGTVGDQPVVAFRYIENYQPQAYNLTKTLSDNEAENVFTFVYQKTATQSGQNGNGQTDAALNNGGNDGGAGNAANGGAGDNAANGGNDGGAGDNAANDGNNGEAGNDAANGENDIVTVEDQETPQDLVNLDDEETPLANMEDADAKPRPMKNMLIFIGIGVAAIAALGVLVAVLLKRKKKNSKAENKIEAEEKEKDGGNNL